MTRRDDGFTLAEVLIALALLGMLTLVAYGAVRFGAFSWQRTTQLRDADAERDAAIRVLTQSIRGAYPAFALDAYSDRRIAFNGAPDRMALISPLPEAIEAGVMAREVFYVRADGEERGLAMNWALDLPAANGGILPIHTVRLAADVSAVRFSYFGVAQSGQPAGWWDDWTGMTSLPQLVRVTAWRADATDVPWLDISVETATTTTTDCVYVPEEPQCRRVQ